MSEMSEIEEYAIEEYASVEDLTSSDGMTETLDVAIPGGRKVKVRGMSRYELMLTRKGTEDVNVMERRMLNMCMLAPRMSEAQIERWQKTTGPMVIAPVTEAIRLLSGLGEGADKSPVREDGSESGD